MGDGGGALVFFKDLRFCRSHAYMLMHHAHVAAVPCVLTFGGQEPSAMLEKYLRAHDSTPQCRSSRPRAVNIANGGTE